MASRTQLRLGQVTGSLNQSVAAATTINVNSLQGVLDRLASGLNNVTGQDFFNVSDSTLKDQNGQSRISYADGAGVIIGAEGDGSTALTIGSSAAGNKDATFAGNIAIPNDGTIGSAGADSAITIASDGVVTFVDDIKVKNDGTIGSAGAPGAITIANNGIVTFADDIKLKNDGTIGNAAVADIITLAANGNVQINASEILQANTINDTDNSSGVTIEGVKLIDNDIVLPDGNATIGSATTPAAITIATNGQITLSGKLEVTGDLDVNGTTTTIDTNNLTVQDSIIGLGVSGSDNSFSNVGDRGIVFAKGAAATSLLPAFYYDGTNDLFQLGKSATSAASASFTAPPQTSFSTLRLGKVQFTAATDFIGPDSNTGHLVIETGNELVLSSSTSTDIIFHAGTKELLRLDSAYSHAMVGALTIDGSDNSTPGALLLGDADGSHDITLKAAGTVGTSYELVLPASKGAGLTALRLNAGATALEFADLSVAGQTSKQVVEVGATLSADTELSLDAGSATTGMTYLGDSIDSLSQANAQGKVLDVFVNGQLLTSGSNAQITAAAPSADYEISSTAGGLKFAFGLEPDDVVQVIKRG